MTAKILSGAEIAGQIKLEVAETVKNLSYQPCLAAVRVGEDAASKVYVGNKTSTPDILRMNKLVIRNDTQEDRRIGLFIGVSNGFRDLTLDGRDANY